MHGCLFDNNIIIIYNKISNQPLKASFLNLDLFRVGIVSGPSCRCGAALENLKHFLFWIVQYIPTSQNYIDR
jgi:hypothetical protein